MSELEPTSVRAGNADREQVVARLHDAFAEGRLDVGELDERVAAAYAAKTLGELVPLTADLPDSGRPAAARPVGEPARAVVGHSGPGRWTPVYGTLAVVVINLVVWAAVSVGTGEWVYFWPVWTAIPFVLAVVGVFARGRSDGDR